MTNLYTLLKQQQEEELKAIESAVIFSVMDLQKALNQLGVTSHKELSLVGVGKYIKKTDLPKYMQLLGKHSQQLKAQYTNYQFLVDMLTVEFEDKGLKVQQDAGNILEQLGFTYEDILTNEVIGKAIDTATENTINNL